MEVNASIPDLLLLCRRISAFSWLPDLRKHLSDVPLSIDPYNPMLVDWTLFGESARRAWPTLQEDDKTLVAAALDDAGRAITDSLMNDLIEGQINPQLLSPSAAVRLAFALRKRGELFPYARRLLESIKTTLSSDSDTLSCLLFSDLAFLSKALAQGLPRHSLKKDPFYGKLIECAIQQLESDPSQLRALDLSYFLWGLLFQRGESEPSAGRRREIQSGGFSVPWRTRSDQSIGFKETNYASDRLVLERLLPLVTKALIRLHSQLPSHEVARVLWCYKTLGHFDQSLFVALRKLFLSALIPPTASPVDDTENLINVYMLACNWPTSSEIEEETLDSSLAFLILLIGRIQPLVEISTLGSRSSAAIPLVDLPRLAHDSIIAFGIHNHPCFLELARAALIKAMGFPHPGTLQPWTPRALSCFSHAYDAYRCLCRQHPDLEPLPRMPIQLSRAVSEQWESHLENPPRLKTSQAQKDCLASIQRLWPHLFPPPTPTPNRKIWRSPPQQRRMFPHTVEMEKHERGYFIDIAIVLRHPPSPDVKLALEVNGPTHFDSDGRPLAKSYLRNLILSCHHWQVIDLPLRSSDQPLTAAEWDSRLRSLFSHPVLHMLSPIK